MSNGRPPMQKILLALALVAASAPALAQQVPMASTDNHASSFIEGNGRSEDAYSAPSAQVAPGEDAATMEGTTRTLPQSRPEHGCHGSERVETPALMNWLEWRRSRHCLRFSLLPAKWGEGAPEGRMRGISRRLNYPSPGTSGHPLPALAGRGEIGT